MEKRMNAAAETLIRHTFQQSGEGRMHFGQVVAALLEAGVESYGVDYRAARVTYFLPDGDTLDLALEGEPAAVAGAFSAEALIAAIRAAQRGDVMYPQFKKLSQAAGCIGYTVWLSGRHVSYYGRNGEVHIEHFPS
jgi:uncharacterized protein YbcV (DUF1398 family)